MDECSRHTPAKRPERGRSDRRSRWAAPESRSEPAARGRAVRRRAEPGDGQRSGDRGRGPSPRPRRWRPSRSPRGEPCAARLRARRATRARGRSHSPPRGRVGTTPFRRPARRAPRPERRPRSGARRRHPRPMRAAALRGAAPRRAASGGAGARRGASRKLARAPGAPQRDQRGRRRTGPHHGRRTRATRLFLVTATRSARPPRWSSHQRCRTRRPASPHVTVPGTPLRSASVVLRKGQRRVRDDQWMALILQPSAVRVRTISSAPAELLRYPRPSLVRVPAAEDSARLAPAYIASFEKSPSGRHSATPSRRGAARRPAAGHAQRDTWDDGRRRARVARVRPPDAELRRQQ